MKRKCWVEENGMIEKSEKWMVKEKQVGEERKGRECLEKVKVCRGRRKRQSPI